MGGSPNPMRATVRKELNEVILELNSKTQRGINQITERLGKKYCLYVKDES